MGELILKACNGAKVLYQMSEVIFFLLALIEVSIFKSKSRLIDRFAYILA